MRRLLSLGLLLLLAGCTFPGFDYDTEPDYPEPESASLELMTLPGTVSSGESLTVYADYSSQGELIEGATCLLKVDDLKYEMTYSSQGYGRTVDTGGMSNGTVFVGVTCKKPGYETKEGGISFSIE